jgi:excisionase family DNA binding protein
MNDVDELLSIKQAAELLSVSADTIRRQIRNNKLKAELTDWPHSKYYCIPRSELKVATEVKDVIPFNHNIAPTELIEKINEALVIRLDECDAALLQKINNVDAKLDLILDKVSTPQTASSGQNKRGVIDRIL